MSIARPSLAALLLVAAGSALCADIPTSAANCNIQLPPERHGEMTGQIVVFPRKADIGNRYTGCQSAWLYDGKTYYRSFVYYFDQGELRMMKIIEPQNPAKFVVCEYKGGKALTINRDCRDLTETMKAGAGLPISSFPKGCHAELMKQKVMPSSCRKD